MMNLVGQQLGNYRLIQHLGQGSFADVYLGEHQYLKTQAAIKVMHNRMSQSDLQDFLKEARTIAELKHPHIVRVLDFGVENNTPFLVMDVAQGTLRQRHTRGSVLPLTTILSYVKQVATALQYAHDHKLIHRDVKPENMLVEANGDILLSDFGIAAIAHSISSMKTQRPSDRPSGTPLYMAPEQWRNQAVRSSDQYALGICVYQWLCGEVPFRGSMEQLMWAHLHQDPPSFKEKGAQVPYEIARVVRRALAKDPEDRYGSVQNFANALEGCLPKPGTLLSTHDHYSKVCSLAWSPDGKRIASGSSNGTAQLWEVTTKRQVFTVNDDFHTKLQGMAFVAWAPNREYIAIGIGGHEVYIYDAVTGSKVPEKTFTGHGSNNVAAMAWSPNGKHIALMSHNDMLQVWDTTTGNVVSTCNCQTTSTRMFGYTVAWSPDNTRIASTTGDFSGYVSDALTGQNIFEFGLGRDSWKLSVAWSPDGTRIASISYNVGVDIWEADTGTHIYTYRGHRTKKQGGWPPPGATTLAWSPDGKYIASGGDDNTVQVWDAATRNQAVTYTGHFQRVNVVAWSPDGKYIASGSDDNTVQVWQAV